jgi:hypothetical protein
MMQDRKGSDSGYLVPGTWYLVPDTRYRINAEGRTPSTEDRARPPENAHTGFASCIPRVRVFRRQVPGIRSQVSGTATWHLVPDT